MSYTLKVDIEDRLLRVEIKSDREKGKTVTNLSKMIMIKQYSREKWEEYWKQKMGISGYFEIHINSVECMPCEHF